MKKIHIGALALCIAITVCTITLLFSKNDLQAVFLSFRTALQKQGTYAIQNKSTENVFILQTEKKAASASLYRRTDNGELLRYRVRGNLLDVYITGTIGWIHDASIVLPENPFLLLIELENILAAKSSDTSTIKLYIDSLLTSLSSVYNDSSIFIDYQALPETLRMLRTFLCSNEAAEMIKMEANTVRTNTVYTIQPYASEDFTNKIIEILSPAMQPTLQAAFQTLLENSEKSRNQVTVQISLTWLGSFNDLTVYEHENSVFSVKKIK